MQGFVEEWEDNSFFFPGLSFLMSHALVIEDAWRRRTAAPFVFGIGICGRKSKPILFSDPAFGEGILEHISETI